jgi:hypothetical protein
MSQVNFQNRQDCEKILEPFFSATVLYREQSFHPESLSSLAILKKKKKQ